MSRGKKPQEAFIPLKEACKRLGLADSTLRGWVGLNKIRGEKRLANGTYSWWINAADVAAHATQRAVAPTNGASAFDPVLPQRVTMVGNPAVNAAVLGAIRGRSGAKTILDICDAVNMGPKQVQQALDDLKAAGEHITVDTLGQIEHGGLIQVGGDDFHIDHSKRWGGKVQRFGYITDNHLGNKHSRLDVLKASFDRYEDLGIQTVFQTGNMIDGEARFNKNELLVHGMDNQVDYFLEHWPQKKGMRTVFVTGDDHEGWYQQREGLNIGEHIVARARAAGRDDLEYIGYGEGNVKIAGPNGDPKEDRWIRLVHPGGGSAYALSYTSQKYVEMLQGGEKPHIVLIGHYHKFDLCYPREVWCLQGGCTCDQTMFMRKKKLQAMVGSSWFEIEQHGEGETGEITRTTWNIMPWYDLGYYKKGPWREV